VHDLCLLGELKDRADRDEADGDDDALVETAAADRLDDGQGLTFPKKTSGQVVRPDVSAQRTAAFRGRQLLARA